MNEADIREKGAPRDAADNPWYLLQSRKGMYSTYWQPIVEAFSKDMARILGEGFDPVLVTFVDETVRWYTTRSSWTRCQQAALKKYDEDQKFFDEIKRTYEKRIPFLFTFLDELEKMSPHDLSNEELAVLHERPYEVYDSVYPWSEPVPFILQDVAEDRLQRFLSDIPDVSPTQKTELFVALTTPDTPSFLDEEEVAFLKFASSGPDETKMERYLDAWGWVPFDYGQHRWTKQEMKDRLEQLQKRDVSQMLKDKDQKRLDDAKQRNELIASSSLSKDILRLANVIRDLVAHNDHKKKIFSQLHYRYRPFLEEIADRLDLTHRQVEFCTRSEVIDALSGKTTIDPFVPDARFKKTALYIEGGQGYGFVDDTSKVDQFHLEQLDAEEHAEPNAQDPSDVLKGMPASTGQYEGIVRILHSGKEANQLQEGEVLVVNMTSPEYVTAMRRAGAIVTNEGGITCHAAVVSRELGVPCVIGTKKATEMFSTGDRVRVDATKGTIERLSSE